MYVSFDSKCIVSFASISVIFVLDFSYLQDFRFFSFIKNFRNTINATDINHKKAFAMKEDKALCCPLLDNTNNYFMDVQSRIDLKHLYLRI